VQLGLREGTKVVGRDFLLNGTLKATLEARTVG
jgi:hypothetical protein